MFAPPSTGTRLRYSTFRVRPLRYTPNSDNDDNNDNDNDDDNCGLLSLSAAHCAAANECNAVLHALAQPLNL